MNSQLDPAEGITLTIPNRNTWGRYSIEALEYAAEGDDGQDVGDYDVKVVTVFGKRRLRCLFVIVEMYDRKGFGRGKRRFLAEFTKEERATLSRWYPKIYAWYLRTGIPEKGVRMSLHTYETLYRFADFFASL